MQASDSSVSGPMAADPSVQPPPADASARPAAPERPELRVVAAEPASPPGDVGAQPDSSPQHGDRQAALRALRNLEATEARLERNARREADEARSKLVGELLPVLDNLDRTIRAAHGGREPAIVEGVRLVRHQLEGVLRGYGVERIDAVGQRFDPGVHEAIGVTPVGDPARHGVVVQQAEPGYRLAGRLLRPAKVSVGKLAAPVEAMQRSMWR